MRKWQVPAALLLSFALMLSLFAAAGAAAGAPVAENLEITTYRGVSIGGRLAATDPDGGACSFEITTEPGKGKLDLDANGHFVYTPADGKRGKDYFGYKAVDEDGNRSQEATVIIRIQKQQSKICYADLAGRGCECAAVRLAEEGVFTGASLAGEYVFSPDAPVTRAEFLAMCMKVAGTKTLTGVRTTGFSDDQLIAAWAKPYVSTALKEGIISGYADAMGCAAFGPARPITAAEAAVMLDRAVRLTDAVAAWYAPDDALPAWAVQSAANISACGLLPAGCSFTDQTLTRASAAELLSGAMDLMNRR